jgi:imidazolonepropionase-like amidohydrolase
MSGAETRRGSARGLAILVLLSTVTSATPSHAEPVDLVIRSATIVDVRDGTLQRDRTIVIRGREIVEVTADEPGRRYSAVRTVDARGRHAIPGLWDMHVHFGGGEALVEENKAFLPLYVAHGVTTVRDAAADLSTHVLAWRTAVADGALLGPTIFTSGPKLEGYRPSWKGTLEVGTPAEVDAALDRCRRCAWTSSRSRTTRSRTRHTCTRSAKRRGADCAPRHTSRWCSRSGR